MLPRYTPKNLRLSPCHWKEDGLPTLEHQEPHNRPFVFATLKEAFDAYILHIKTGIEDFETLKKSISFTISISECSFQRMFREHYLAERSC